MQLAPEELAQLHKDVAALVDRLEKPPDTPVANLDFKFESVGFMTKNGKPKWKRAYMVLLGDNLLFNNSRSKVRYVHRTRINNIST